MFQGLFALEIAFGQLHPDPLRPVWYPFMQNVTNPQQKMLQKHKQQIPRLNRKMLPALPHARTQGQQSAICHNRHGPNNLKSHLQKEI